MRVSNSVPTTVPTTAFASIHTYLESSRRGRRFLAGLILGDPRPATVIVGATYVYVKPR